jgi:peptidyl-prolyl cis-trans isomerase C
LVEDRVREEVLYREALALGLDKDDTIVRRRMAQKIQFLAEDAAHEPTREELATWYQANRGQFALSSRVSFRHLYFSPDRRGARARDDAAAALTKLAGQSEDSSLGASLFRKSRTNRKQGR